MAEIDRIRIVVEPDTSGFERELKTEIGKISTEIQVPIEPDTRGASSELDAWRKKQQSDDIQIPVDASTVAASAEIAAFTKRASAPILKTVQANIAPAIAGLKAIQAQATRIRLIDPSQAIAGLKSIERQALASFGRIRASATGITTAIGVAGGFAAALGVQELKDASLVSAQTEQILKQTGLSASVSAKEIEKLTGALLEKSGIDDQAIQGATNFLLTQEAIRDTIKQQPQFLGRATNALADLAASPAFSGNVASASRALGKALADPEKGLTALRRVGVIFTKEQKDLVKSLVESGDTAGAQAIILGKVEQNLGGLSEAYGSSVQGLLTRSSEAISLAGARILEPLLPSLARLAEGLANAFGDTGIVTRFITAIAPVGKAVRDVAAAFAGGFFASGDTTKFIDGVSTSSQSLAKSLKALAPDARALGEQFRAALPALIDFAREFGSLAIKIGGKIGADLIAIGRAVAPLALGIVKAAAGLARFANESEGVTKSLAAIGTGFLLLTKVPGVGLLLKLLGPVAKIVGRIAILFGKNLIPVILKFGRFLLPLVGVIGSIVAAIGIVPIAIAAVVAAIAFFLLRSEKVRNALKAAGVAIVEFFKSLPAKIGAFLTAAKAILAAVPGFFKRAFDAAFNFVKSAVVAYIKFVTFIPRKTIGALISLAVQLAGFFRRVWSGAIAIVRLVVGNYIAFVRAIPARVIAGLASLGALLLSAARTAWTRYKNAVSTVVGTVIGFVRRIPGRILSALGNLGESLAAKGRAAFAGLLDGIKEGWEKVKDFVSGIAQKIKDLKGPIEVDRKLLVDEGKAIMDGFQRGLETRWQSVASFLRARGDEIEGTLSRQAVARIDTEAGNILTGNASPGAAGRLLDFIRQESLDGLHPTTGAEDTAAQANRIAARFGLVVTSLVRRLDTVPGPSVSQHVLGQAADFVGTAQALDRAATALSRLIDRVFKQVIWRNSLWRNGRLGFGYVPHHGPGDNPHLHLGWIPRRVGGRVSAGRLYEVNEGRRREAFVPDLNGFVMSHSKLNRMLSLSHRVDAIERATNRSVGSSVTTGGPSTVNNYQTSVELHHAVPDASSLISVLNARLQGASAGLMSGRLS